MSDELTKRHLTRWYLFDTLKLGEKQMQPIRLIYNNLPNSLLIPEEFQNKSAEIIIWPLESQNGEAKITKRPYGLAKGLFQVPPDFFEPLPDSILSEFGID